MNIVVLLLYLPLALAKWNYMDHNFKIPKKTRGTGPTSTKRPDATTRQLFYFEGVDYDAMPDELRNKNNDCYAHFVWCIQNQTLMNPVCGWNLWTYRLDDYYSPCEIEVQNCRHRVNGYYYKRPQKGNDMRNDLVYYNGEGYDCKYYARMGGDIVQNYFGNRRLLISQDEISNRMDYSVLV